MKTFVVSDTHFGHRNIVKFERDGKPVRPWDDVEQMDEDLVRLWNETVSPEDKVYHLGDVVINKKHLPIMNRLNGRKVLIKGNHDIGPISTYLEYFDDVRAVHNNKHFVMTHVPMHPQSLKRWGVNVHGHLHTDRVLMPDRYQKTMKIDPNYFCVSVEQIDFKPIDMEELLVRINEQLDNADPQDLLKERI